jgi:hypothetical protein
MMLIAQIIALLFLLNNAYEVVYCLNLLRFQSCCIYFMRLCAVFTILIALCFGD